MIDGLTWFPVRLMSQLTTRALRFLYFSIPVAIFVVGDIVMHGFGRLCSNVLYVWT